MTPNVKIYLTTLTPLRGIAAMLVAVYHFEVVARFVAPESSMFLRKGYLMVDLFFIISGFIMLHVYGATFQNRITRRDLANFLMARFARIYPLHLFTLVWALIVSIIIRSLARGLDPFLRLFLIPLPHRPAGFWSNRLTCT